ncbi:GNAT family protein [uncultured Nitrosomonas sp.]|uniref:GNAT family N-acetyltransferase n=1 Tax=uncultured Nitrosomonas sp. TaxID=156424 RepID=UPI0025E9FBA9|nr:GNAT family protein [uncultured Nitrosomonas sp.]
MLELSEKNSTETFVNSNPIYWINLVDDQFRQKNFGRARDFIIQALANFPDHPVLLDRLFIVDQRWNSLIACNKIHLSTPAESDFSFLQQCYANEEFMEQFLPMGRKKQSTESILAALRNNEFPVAQSRTMHRIIKKEECADQLQTSLNNSGLKPIGLASLVDIQIAHRRAELLIGIPDNDDRQRVSGVTMLLILDFAFNQIGLHKLTSLVMANNPHSQKSTEAIGFIREGLRRHHLRDPKSRAWVDCYENGLVEDSFRANPVIARVSKRLLGRDITLQNV